MRINKLIKVAYNLDLRRCNFDSSNSISKNTDPLLYYDYNECTPQFYVSYSLQK